jgi:hypothetical protein
VGVWLRPSEREGRYWLAPDLAAQWSAGGGRAFYAYSANYLIDTAAGIVVDVEATPAHRTDEINATKAMIERVEVWFDLKPQRLIGDTNYGTAENAHDGFPAVPSVSWP